MQPQHQQHRQQLAFLLCDAHPWRVQQRPRQGPQAQQRARDALRAAATLVCRAAATTAAKSNQASPAGVQMHSRLLGSVCTSSNIFSKQLQLSNPREHVTAATSSGFSIGMHAGGQEKNQDHKLFDEAVITVRSADLHIA